MITNIEAQMGIYLKEKDWVILSCKVFEPKFKKGMLPKISFSYVV